MVAGFGFGRTGEVHGLRLPCQGRQESAGEALPRVFRPVEEGVGSGVPLRLGDLPLGDDILIDPTRRVKRPPGQQRHGVEGRVAGEQKPHYDVARQLTLAHCYDLNLLTVNMSKMYYFFTKNGIPARLLLFLTWRHSWTSTKEQGVHDGIIPGRRRQYCFSVVLCFKEFPCISEGIPSESRPHLT